MTFKYYAFMDSPGRARVEPIAGPVDFMQCLKERTMQAADTPSQGSLAGDMAEAWTLWDAIDESQGECSTRCFQITNRIGGLQASWLHLCA